jgi:hypothetical protein
MSPRPVRLPQLFVLPPSCVHCASSSALSFLLSRSVSAGGRMISRRRCRTPRPRLPAQSVLRQGRCTALPERGVTIPPYPSKPARQRCSRCLRRTAAGPTPTFGWTCLAAPVCGHHSSLYRCPAARPPLPSQPAQSPFWDPGEGVVQAVVVGRTQQVQVPPPPVLPRRRGAGPAVSLKP